MNKPSHTAPRRIAIAALVLATILLGFANLWFAVHRSEGYAYRFADYVSIYHPQEWPTIREFADGAPGQVEPVFSVAPDPRWGLGPDGGVPLGTGLHAFPVSGPGAEAERTATVRVTAYTPPVFSTADFAVGRFDQYPLRELAYRPDQYPAEHVEKVTQLIVGTAVGPEEAALLKTRKIWKLLYPQLDAHRHGPHEWTHRLPAFEQYEAMMSGKAGGLCSNFAEIYALFSTVAGVPIRIVNANRRVSGRVDLAAHTFTEIYLPEEAGWAYSDMNLNVFGVRDRHTGRHMNTVQLAHLHEAGAVGGLVATVHRDGELVDVPYPDVSREVGLHINPNATFVFLRFYENRSSPLPWFDRYILRPELAYGLYRTNTMHYAKLIAFYGTLSIGVAWLALIVRWLRSRRPPAGDHASSVRT